VSELECDLDFVAAETHFSGAVRVDESDRVVMAKAYGLADRAHEIANTLETRFAIASGTKGLTALTVMSLVEDGRLGLSTPARSVLGEDLPLIRDDVTVEHLLSHRSGIGDYLDEETEPDLGDYLMPVPVHDLASTDRYLVALEGHRTKFDPDERFSYCNSGYVVLALIAERVAGLPFHELVQRRVCDRAGLADTEFLRSDELPGRTAIGYLETEGLRSNIFHLPVLGSGDGGIYTTAADVHAFWQALFAGAIVSRRCLDEMLRPRTHEASGARGYGLGFWLSPPDAVSLVGMDAGVSFCSRHDPDRQLTTTVLSNTTKGAPPITEWLEQRFWQFRPAGGAREQP